MLRCGVDRFYFISSTRKERDVHRTQLTNATKRWSPGPADYREERDQAQVKVCGGREKKDKVTGRTDDDAEEGTFV